MAGGESQAHRDLKRLALAWAQQQGFRIAAAEVSVPHLGACRMDAAAYRPEFIRQKDTDTKRWVQMPSLGATAIFECKSSRADFLKDSRCAAAIAKRLSRLHECRALYEESMRHHLPTLRKGETLFAEFDAYSFETAGFEPYDKICAEIRTLSKRLHSQTKFDKLTRWKAANLYYLVAAPGVAKLHEVPAGWGLLVQREEKLEVIAKAVWQEASEFSRWTLLLRIAMGGTRAVNRQMEVNFAELGPATTG